MKFDLELPEEKIFNSLSTSEKLRICFVVKKIMNLKSEDFTGQLRFNFHEGNLSEKIEKKESVKLE